MRRRRSPLARFATAALIAFAPFAQAANYCVGTPAQLAAALTDSATNGQNDGIRLLPGIYTRVPADAQTPMFSLVLENGYSLVISGGWNPGCNSQITQAASATVIDGDYSHRLFSVATPGGTFSGTFSLLNMTFRRGTVLGDYPLIDIAPDPLSTVNTTIDNVAFIENTRFGTGTSAAVRIHGSKGTLRVRSSLFRENTASTIAVQIDVGGYLYFNGSTVSGNRATTAVTGIGGVRFNGFDAVEAHISNSVIWGNTSGSGPIDLYAHSLDLVFHNSHLGTRSYYFSAPVAYELTEGDPRVISATNPRPLPDSPLRNSGVSNPIGGSTNYDIDGRPRNFEGTPDRGAYEFEVLFSSGFE